MDTANLDRAPTTHAAEGLVEALRHRDFVAMQTWLDDDVEFRALIPPGIVQHATATASAGQFEQWFGDADYEFEVVESAVGRFGARAYARWVVRMWPVGQPDQTRRAEQHVYLSGGERVARLDLICSGFQSETN